VQTLRSVHAAALPRWRRGPAQPYPRPAHPIGMRVPQFVRRRWMAHRPSLKAWHSAQPPRLLVLCLHAIVLAHDLRERSAQQFERSQREGLELYPERHSRGGGDGLTSLASLVATGFWCCLLQWGPAEVRKALGGKHARRSNTPSVRRAPAPLSPLGHDASLVTPSPGCPALQRLQQLRWAPRPCLHHAHY
jgi:hypothetical protein